MESDARWVTNVDRAQATRALASLLPPEVTAVAGVSRSGVSSALQIAELLHLHPFAISLRGDLTKLTHGARFGRARPDDGLLAVVDDTVASGRSLKVLQTHRQRIGRKHLYAVTYASPEARGLVDFYAELLPLPHYLEWNFFNSGFVRSTAFDFDGVLCRDCRAEEDDDGLRYRNFLRDAAPRYLVRRSVIPLIITARLEKYRTPTEAWLERWNVRCEHLVMGPWRTLRARRAAYDAGAHKGRGFRDSQCTLFVESCRGQAVRIAEVSGKRVICPTTAEVWN